jgi:hypothetical protein
MAERTDVFISYSHYDNYWLERVKVHLRPLARGGKLVVWEDTKLRGGDNWEEEIEKALAKTKVAVLLISPDFLASDFIDSDELPPLLKAAQEEGATILPVFVSDCDYGHSVLAPFQGINSLGRPLKRLSEGEVDAELLKLTQRVRALLVPEAVRVVSTETPILAVPPAVAVGIPVAAQVASPHILPATQAIPSALLVRNDGTWAVIDVTGSDIRNGSEVKLTLQPANSTERIFLSSLSQGVGLAGIVFNDHAYACRLREANAQTAGDRRESWHLLADAKAWDTGYDMTFNGVTPEQQAQQKAIRLLLNDQPAENSPRGFFGYADPLPQGHPAPLFALYHHVQRQHDVFNQYAPLVAAWYLRVNGVVTDILHLTAEARGEQLYIDFAGERQRNPHEPVANIQVKGERDFIAYLPAEALPLRLPVPKR